MYFKHIAFIFITFVILGCQDKAKQTPAEINKIAQAYGVDNFEQIELLEFTFHVEKSPIKVKRSWTWEPKTGKVTYQDEKDAQAYTYNTKNLKDDKKEKEIDSKFINDHYWLIFPFRLAWDTGFSHKLQSKVAPISSKERDCLIVSYNNVDGYTPGDTYEFYCNEKGLIEEWTYRKGGSDKVNLSCTWEDNKKLGPITVSLDHKSKDGSFRLWFSDVRAKVNGAFVTPK